MLSFCDIPSLFSTEDASIVNEQLNLFILLNQVLYDLFNWLLIAQVNFFALTTSTQFSYLLADFFKEIAAEVKDEDSAAEEPCQLKSHFFANSRACSRDHHEAILIKPYRLFFAEETTDYMCQYDRQNYVRDYGWEAIKNIWKVDHNNSIIYQWLAYLFSFASSLVFFSMYLFFFADFKLS